MDEDVYVISAPIGLAFAAALNAPVSVPVLSVPGPVTEQTVALVAPAGAVSSRENDVRLLLSRLNAERKSIGLPELGLDPTLSTIAQNYAVDMATHRFFGHTSPAGDTPFTRMDRAGFKYGYAGENIALDDNADAASKALYSSNAHRQNILEPHYQRVGIAAVMSSSGEIFVEDFSD